MVPTPIPTSIRLHYFNGRSRGELIRYILLYAQIPFVDNRIDRTIWPQIKPKFPTGQVPVLEYMNEKGEVKLLVQNNSIVRTCARWFGLAGQNSVEMAEADQAHECMRDIADAASQLAFETDGLKQKTRKYQVENEVVPRMLRFLEKKLAANGGKCIAGGKSFTYADLSVAVVLDHVSRDLTVVPNIICRPPVVDLTKLEKQFPGIVGLKKRVEQVPPIESYLASRPDTPF